MNITQSTKPAVVTLSVSSLLNVAKPVSSAEDITQSVCSVTNVAQPVSSEEEEIIQSASLVLNFDQPISSAEDITLPVTSVMNVTQPVSSSYLLNITQSFSFTEGVTLSTSYIIYVTQSVSSALNFALPASSAVDTVILSFCFAKIFTIQSDSDGETLLFPYSNSSALDSAPVLHPCLSGGRDHVLQTIPASSPGETVKLVAQGPRSSSSCALKGTLGVVPSGVGPVMNSSSLQMLHAAFCSTSHRVSAAQ